MKLKEKIVRACMHLWLVINRCQIKRLIRKLNKALEEAVNKEERTNRYED